MLLRVFLDLTNQVCNYFEFLCKTYFVFENLKEECLKILILEKLGVKLIFWKSISSHTHAFYSLYSMLWGVFFKNHIIFSKMLFFQNFDWSNLFFDQLKLNLKFFVSLRLFRSIETRELGFKKSVLTCSNKLFLNFFLSLWVGKAPQRFFCHFPPNFLQGFSLPKPHHS